MRRKQRKKVKAARRVDPKERGPSLVFYIALLLGLIMLAYLGYIAATTQVTPPSVIEAEQ